MHVQGPAASCGIAGGRAGVVAAPRTVPVLRLHGPEWGPHLRGPLQKELGDFAAQSCQRAQELQVDSRQGAKKMVVISGQGSAEGAGSCRHAVDSAPFLHPQVQAIHGLPLRCAFRDSS